MSTYWTYYLLLSLLAYGSRQPVLLALVVVFYLFRDRIPDPLVWLRTSGRIRSLKTDIAANPANVTARRDLASMYLDRRRPGAALRLLDEARQRDPDDAELLFLTGKARLMTGDAAGAVESLVESGNRNPKLRYGEAILVAAAALMKLGRWDEAEEALEHYLKQNRSSMEGCARLALVRREKRDAEGQRRAIAEALSTWAQIPAHSRRRQWRHWLRVRLLQLGL